MMKKLGLYHKLYSHFNLRLWKRIIRRHHRWRRVEKTYNAISKVTRFGFYFGELILIFCIMGISFLFGKGSPLPNNTSLLYPLHQVSTLACRTLKWDTMPDSCKINLPIIHGANYQAYADNDLYTSIYTVHRGASYTSGWDNTVGTHYWTDIATAWGTPLYAIADGVVYSSVYNSAYGNVVKIKFKYQWEILYAVYAHMSERLVEAGDTVQAGDLIGKVGNSGNVFGALGWYHVHFEIDKDNNGRPSYVFTSCPTISKGDYAVIQAGECRMQLFQYTKDPIVLLENAHASYPVISEMLPIPFSGEILTGGVSLTGTVDPIWTGSLPDSVVTGTLAPIGTGIVSSGTTTVVTGTLSYEHQSAPEKNPNTSFPSTSLDQISTSTGTLVYPSDSDSTLVNKTSSDSTHDPHPQSESAISPSVDLVPVVEKQPIEKQHFVTLTFDQLDFAGKDFTSKWDLQIEKLFPDTVSVGEPVELMVYVHNKSSGDAYQGTLKQPLRVIASTTSITANPASTTVISKGKATITLSPQETGEVYLALLLGNTKIGSIPLTIVSSWWI